MVFQAIVCPASRKARQRHQIPRQQHRAASSCLQMCTLTVGPQLQVTILAYNMQQPVSMHGSSWQRTFHCVPRQASQTTPPDTKAAAQSCQQLPADVHPHSGPTTAGHSPGIRNAAAGIGPPN